MTKLLFAALAIVLFALLAQASTEKQEELKELKGNTVSALNRGLGFFSNLIAQQKQAEEEAANVRTRYLRRSRPAKAARAAAKPEPVEPDTPEADSRSDAENVAPSAESAHNNNNNNNEDVAELTE